MELKAKHMVLMVVGILSSIALVAEAQEQLQVDRVISVGGQTAFLGEKEAAIVFGCGLGSKKKYIKYVPIAEAGKALASEGSCLIGQPGEPLDDKTLKEISAAKSGISCANPYTLTKKSSAGSATPGTGGPVTDGQTGGANR